jgi:polar amino acid transport system ATP-binding protein
MNNLILAPRLVQRLPKEECIPRALALLERVGLAEKRSAFPRELSGGQKQRVAIMRALMMQPEIMLLDEVTAALDPEMVQEVLEVVLELANDGVTMVVVTHEIRFARALADRVLFMIEGEVVEISEPDLFFTTPATERATQFLRQFEYKKIRRDDSYAIKNKNQ